MCVGGSFSKLPSFPQKFFGKCLQGDRFLEMVQVESELHGNQDGILMISRFISILN